MTAKRTRGPWRKVPVHQSDEFGKVTIVGHLSRHVAEVWNGNSRDPDVADANAEFICMAEHMVEALRALIPWAQSGSVGPSCAKAVAEARRLVDRADALAEFVPNLPINRRKPK